jgi:lipid-binding SYLF domain-containing protein
MKTISAKLATAALFACGTLTFLPSCGNDPVTNFNAASVNPRQLADDSRASLNRLYRTNPAAKRLGKSAKGILVFPEITKGGFMIGGMGGNGALIRPDGGVRDFYQVAGVSYGLQIGVQRHGYALFLMDDDALANLNRASGWELGSSPNLVVVDQGMAATLSTKTINRGTYAFIFNQRGLMGGIGLQGAKITRIHPPR